VFSFHANYRSAHSDRSEIRFCFFELAPAVLTIRLIRFTIPQIISRPSPPESALAFPRSFSRFRPLIAAHVTLFAELAHSCYPHGSPSIR